MGLPFIGLPTNIQCKTTSIDYEKVYNKIKENCTINGDALWLGRKAEAWLKVMAAYHIYDSVTAVRLGSAPDLMLNYEFGISRPSPFIQRNK